MLGGGLACFGVSFRVWIFKEHEKQLGAVLHSDGSLGCSISIISIQTWTTTPSAAPALPWGHTEPGLHPYWDYWGTSGCREHHPCVTQPRAPLGRCSPPPGEEHTSLAHLWRVFVLFWHRKQLGDLNTQKPHGQPQCTDSSAELGGSQSVTALKTKPLLFMDTPCRSMER